MQPITPQVWRSSGTITCEAVVVDRRDGQTPLGTLRVLDGEITMDATRDVRWSASLTVAATTVEGEKLLPLRVGSLVHPVTDQWIAVTLGRGPDQVACGVYVVDQASPAGPASVQLDLVDLSRALYVQQAYQSVSGSLSVADALRYVLANAGGLVHYQVPDGSDEDLVPASGLVVSTPGEDPWPIAVKLATTYGHDLAPDRQGVITASPLKPPARPVWQVVEGEDCTVSELSISARRGEYHNAISVPSTQAAGSWTGMLVQTHPSDPYAYPGVPVAPLAPDLAFTTEWVLAAANVARRVLPRIVAANDPVIATGLPAPFLDADDIAVVHAPSRGITGPHWVRGWTCPVGPGKGTVRLHPVREVLAAHG
jgi:hypothetical protein